jgi:hypothetical protein
MQVDFAGHSWEVKTVIDELGSELVINNSETAEAVEC